MGKDTASHSRGRLMAILCVLVLVDGSEGVEKAAVEPFHNSRADVHSDVHWVRSSLSILAQRLSDRTQPQVQLLVARTLVGHLAQAVADRLGVHATEMQSDLPNRSPSQRPTHIDRRQTRTISPTASTCLRADAHRPAAVGKPAKLMGAAMIERAHGQNTLTSGPIPNRSRLDIFADSGDTMPIWHQDWMVHYGVLDPVDKVAVKQLVKSIHERGLRVLFYNGFGITWRSKLGSLYDDYWMCWPMRGWTSRWTQPWPSAVCTTSSREFTPGAIGTLPR